MRRPQDEDGDDVPAANGEADDYFKQHPVARGVQRTDTTAQPVGQDRPGRQHGSPTDEGDEIENGDGLLGLVERAEHARPVKTSPPREAPPRTRHARQ